MTGPHVVFAHGFTQTARSWDVIGALLADRVNALSSVSVDLPGHGEAAEVRGDLWHAADHLTALGGTGTYVGYSMGGRIALHAAIAHADIVTGLVLIGATAGIDDADERRRRQRSDEALAARIETIGIERFVDEWLANPLFAGLDTSTSGREDRLRNSAAALAECLRSTGTGVQEPLWSRLGEIRCPTLVIVGERDEKFCELGERLRDGIVDAELAIVPDSGHSVHLEQPVHTATVIADFLTTRAA